MYCTFCIFHSFFYIPDGDRRESKEKLMMNVVYVGKFNLMCEKIQVAIEHDGWIDRNLVFMLLLAISDGVFRWSNLLEG